MSTVEQEPVVVTQRRPVPTVAWIVLVVGALVLGGAIGFVSGGAALAAGPTHEAAVCKQAYTRELAVTLGWTGVTTAVSRTAGTVLTAGVDYYPTALGELSVQQDKIADLTAEQTKINNLGCKSN